MDIQEILCKIPKHAQIVQDIQEILLKLPLDERIGVQRKFNTECSTWLTVVPKIIQLWAGSCQIQVCVLCAMLGELMFERPSQETITGIVEYGAAGPQLEICSVVSIVSACYFHRGLNSLNVRTYNS